MTDDKPLRAVVWAAVSTRPQAEAEKDSLPDQVRQGETLAAKEGWHLISTLQVPGHSRRYLDFHELAKDARAQGIDAFDNLLRLIDTRAFDVLVVRDGDRFARTQALHAFITESIIDAGARIFSLADGWIDEHNYRMWIAMSGYKAAGEIDALRKKQDIGFKKRVERGLHIGTPPFSHLLIRDSKTGRPARLVIDESRRRFFDDLFTLMLEGVAYDNLEVELYARYGHADPQTGNRYGLYTCVRLLKNPFFWGHSAYGYRKHGGNRAWLYDESVPVPDGVIIYWNTHEAVYTGERGEQIKAEMRRRSGIKGRARPRTDYMFSGLLRCAECGATLTVSANYTSPKRKTIRVSYYCPTKYRHSGLVCTQTHHINQKKIKQYVHLLLTARLQGETLTPDVPPAINHVAQLQVEISALTAQIGVLIEAQTTTQNDSLRQIYTQKIEAAGARLETLKRQLTQAEQLQRDRQAEQRSEALAIQEIGAVLDQFWSRPPREIHQLLHQVFRHARLVVRDGAIIGLLRI